MKLSLFFEPAVAAVLASPALAQDLVRPIEMMDAGVIEALDLRCGTRAIPISEASSFLPPSDCSYNNTNPTEEYAPTTLLEIPVVVHVIQRTTGTGFISEAKVRSQIDILNEDFRALAGTNGSAGTDSMIQFYLATTDPSGNPTTGITYSTNNTWYNDSGSYWNSLAWDTDRYLNIYTNDAGGALGYVPGLPQNSGLVGANADRVVCYWAAFGRNSPSAPYDQGRTATHEVGHYLGLFHTFDFGCGTVSNCDGSGDRICDTNRTSAPTYGCPSSSSSCSSSDPYRNYMDYSNDLCMTNFTPEQVRRMRCTLQFYRPDLASSPAVCASASAVSRNSGINPQTFFATPPTLGSTMFLSVDIASTGHPLGIAFGFGGQADLTLSNGYKLLVDVTSLTGEMLGLAATSGSGYAIPIPFDAALCGLQVNMQGLHFGNGSYVLTNAFDAVVGS